jgi:putative endonuclease
MAMRLYYVYITTGLSGIFYTGMTNDLVSRTIDHRCGDSEFTGRYRLGRLVYFESTPDVREAIAREKQIKRWRREKKIALIKQMNPRFLDLGETVLGLPALRPDSWPWGVSRRSSTNHRLPVTGPSTPLRFGRDDKEPLRFGRDDL